MTEPAPPVRRGAEALYALAYLGAHLSFMPLFVLLLPRRVEAMAPTNSVALLSVLLLIGGVTASLAHVGAGAISDRWIRRRGNRRGLIAIGALSLALAYVALAWSTNPMALGGGIIAFQCSLNLMFAPLGAVLADHVDDQRKGRVAALMNIALPLSGVGTALLGALFPVDGAGAFMVIGTISVLAVVPLLWAWPFNTLAEPSKPDAASDIELRRADYGRVWGARLLMQLGAAFLLNYFYLFVAAQPGVDAPMASRVLGALAGAAMVTSVAAALLSGRWSDHTGKRRRPMIAGALMSAMALILLVSFDVWPAWALGYVLFSAGLTAFLSIDSALVAQLVGGHPRRGELLGYMNLTNTLPSILVPLLTLTATGAQPDFDWRAGFGLSALLALGAAVLVARVRAIR